MSYTIGQLIIGQKAEFSKTISETDSYLYAGITGDFNPIHVNKPYSQKSIYGERIAHGFLTTGFISTVIGIELPDPGTVYLKQSMTFLRPVMIDETITATVSVMEKNVEKNRVILKTECFNEKEELVLTGEAVVMPPQEKL